MSIKAEDLKALKAGGVMAQKQEGLFSARLRVVGGRLTADQLRGLAALAEALGSGEVHLTVRQGMEIPNVRRENLERVRAGLAELGLSVGVCGPTVRTVTACQAERCPHGIIPAQQLGQEIDSRFYGQGGLPHKFKFAVAGCTNACTKPAENDLGINGVAETAVDTSLCNACRACVLNCPTKCITVERDNDQVRVVRDQSRCIYCGVCAEVCPTGAWTIARTGYRVTVGGKMGRFPAFGYVAFPFVATADEVLKICENTLDFYKRHGRPGERFRQTLDRVGLNAYRQEVAPWLSASQTE